MALNQAQLMAVPGGPGVVGAVQAGTGITISGTGVISAVTYSGPTPPPGPTIGTLWYDSSTTPGVLKVWDGTQWVPIGGDTSTLAGQGLAAAGAALKVKITTNNAPPAPSTLPAGAIAGSMYWDNNLGELFIYYNDGQTSQWVQTSYGASGGAGVIPAGTSMIFVQAAAPEGWTKVTTYDNRAIRLVSGTGGATGGTIGFNTLFSATSSYSGSIRITSGNVGNTTLTTAQLPKHDHGIPFAATSTAGTVAGMIPLGTVTGTVPTTDTGSGQAHTHSLANVNASGTFTSNFALQYVDAIVCTKT